jgi:hypothetical protein
MLIPSVMNGLEKSITFSRSAVMVRPATAKSAFWKEQRELISRRGSQGLLTTGCPCWRDMILHWLLGSRSDSKEMQRSSDLNHCSWKDSVSKLWLMATCGHSPLNTQVIKQQEGSDCSDFISSSSRRHTGGETSREAPRSSILNSSDSIYFLNTTSLMLW